ncbi:MAG: Ig-like domain-containing protein [Oscillospiraceae bacterium]|nr:Ig-like domain-containing protein [Oscillospiraceae bacterium]
MRKFISLALIVLIITSMLGNLSVFAQNNTAMLDPSEYAYITNGNESASELTKSETGYHGVYENYNVSSDQQKPNNPSEPVRATYWKFDLSEYINEGYGIEKVEILHLGDVYSWSAPICMYDCPSNDLVTGSNYLNVPKIDASKKIATFSLENAVSVTEKYEGVTGYYNVSVDVTDYVKEKIGSGNKSFTYMLYPQYAQSTYRLWGKPLLYVTLGEKNADLPVITHISDNSDVENATEFTMTVTATDDNGIDKVEFYDNGNLLDGNVTSNGAEFTYLGKALSPGNHTITVKAYDKYGKFSTIDKDISIVAIIAILDPIAKVKVKNGYSAVTSVDENGGGRISSLDGSKDDVENPTEALYYRFDLSSITNNSMGIVSAYILQNADSRTYATSVAMYDCPDNTLVNGMNYSNVPKASLNGMFAKFDITNLENVDLASFPGVTNSYNLALDVTEYVQEKTDGKDGFTFMIYPKFDGSAYQMTSSPILYLNLGNVDTDSPSAEFVSSSTSYSDKGGFTEKVKASDSSGIGSIKIYIDETELAGGYTVSGDIYTFTGAPLTSGNHTLKCVVKDIYGRKTEIFKEITVTMSHAVIYPTATAYTAWGDENQTSEKYALNNDAAYWVMATDYTEDGGISAPEKNSKYWTEPKRAIYAKFDLSEYTDNGFSVTKAYIVQNSQTGGETYGILLDCPSDDLENGDNYLTAPAYDKEEITKYSVGIKTDTYFNSESMQYNFPGARSGDNFALDITNYAIKKLEDKNSFTVMEYPRYAKGQIRFGNLPTLYVEFVQKPDITLLDTSSFAYENQDTIFAAKVSGKNKIDRVEYYLNDNLIASNNINVNGIYAAAGDNVPDGTYELKVKAVDINGAVTTAVYRNYSITNKMGSNSLSSEVSPQGLKDFFKNKVSYIVISDTMTVSDLKSAFTSYNVNVYSSDDGRKMEESDKIQPADNVVVTTKDENSVVRKYIAVKSGYYSPVDLKIMTGTPYVSASAEAFTTKSEDLKLIIIGYKDGELENVHIERYDNTVGDVTMYTETEMGSATEFKALLWRGMTPVSAPSENNLQTVILKFDDFTIWSYSGFDKLMDYLDGENISAGFGAIAQTFDKENEANYDLTPWYEGLYENTVKTLKRAQESPLYEIWSHGYAHSQNEFSTTDYDSMKQSLDKVVSVMGKHGVTIRTFGSPFNTATTTTLKVIEENFPDIKTVMLFNNFMDIPDYMVNIQNHACPEIQVGTVSYDFFIKEYEKYQKSDYVLLQSHPGNWNDESFEEFKKIIEFLKNRGVKFMTPTQYHDYVKGEN